MLRKLLDKPVSVTMVLLTFVVLGILGIGKLPVSLIPDVDIPYVTVQVTDSGMSARELEDVVVAPLRQSLMQINHLKNITAESRDGSAIITLTFEDGRDIDYFYIEVNEKIDRAMASLPGIERPKVIKASATDIPAFYINMTMKDASGDFLRASEFAEDVIARRLEQLDEVAMVDISGTADRELLVIPDREALTRLGLTLPLFERCISSANVSLSNLTIRDGEYHYNVRFRSFASTKEDIGNVYFKVGDRLLQVKDVASVQERPAERTGFALSDGKDAVILAVIKQSSARMSDLKKRIDEQTGYFSEDYPELEFKVTRDQTRLLEYSIRNLLWNIIVAILLDCIIIFLFMKDLRSPLLVSLTIPVSLVISFFVFYVAGLSINIISLSGLLLGVGMMVDNAIVVTDNITARWLKGERLMDAVVRGTQEVSGAMLSSVLTTCVVFIPLLFLNGLAGKLFRDQAIAVTTVLLVSYLVTVIALPVYYWTLYRKKDVFQPNRTLEKISMDPAVRLYDRTVGWCLANKWISWALPLAFFAIAACCLLFMPKEKLPPITYTDAILNIDWNEEITLEESRSRLELLQKEAGGQCSQVTVMAGVQQFVLGHSADQGMSEASMYVDCTDAAALKKLKAGLGAFLMERYPRSSFSFSTSGNIFDTVFSEKEAELLCKLRPTEGYLDVERLRSLLAGLRKDIPGIRIPEIPTKEDVVYVSDPELMSLYGVGFSDLVNVLSNALNGNILFNIVQGNRSVPVVLGTDSEGLQQVLDNSYVNVDDGGSIPVSALMRQTFGEDFKTIVSGEEGIYYPVALDLRPSDVGAAVSGIRKSAVADGNFDASFAGAYFSNKEMTRQMILVLLVAVLILFLILASQFESLIQPAIILSEEIIDIGAALVFCWIFGVSLNMMTLIGLIVISGIVINDSILKIDTINRLVKQGREIEEAVHEAGHRRLKAIVMTSLTTVLAVAPFLSRGNMGDDLQYPMAFVIIAGMTVGTLVSLFFVPALYSAIYSRRR